MKYAMHIRLQIAMLTLVCGAGVFAQNPADTDAEANYSKTIQERADKIVAALEISDTNKFTRVSNLIAFDGMNFDAVNIARQTEVFRGFLAFSQFPVWTVTPLSEPANGFRVELSDLRFGASPGRGFTATAILDSQLRVVSTSFQFL